MCYGARNIAPPQPQPGAYRVPCPPGAKSACTPPLLVFSKTKNIFVLYYLMRTNAHNNGGKRPPACCATVSATSRHLSHRRALSLCSGATLSLLFSHLLSCRPLLSSPPLTASSSPRFSCKRQCLKCAPVAVRGATSTLDPAALESAARPLALDTHTASHVLRRARTAQGGVVKRIR